MSTFSELEFEEIKPGIVKIKHDTNLEMITSLPFLISLIILILVGIFRYFEVSWLPPNSLLIAALAFGGCMLIANLIDEDLVLDSMQKELSLIGKVAFFKRNKHLLKIGINDVILVNGEQSTQCYSAGILTSSGTFIHLGNKVVGQDREKLVEEAKKLASKVHMLFEEIPAASDLKAGSTSHSIATEPWTDTEPLIELEATELSRYQIDFPSKAEGYVSLLFLFLFLSFCLLFPAKWVAPVFGWEMLQSWLSWQNIGFSAAVVGFFFALSNIKKSLVFDIIEQKIYVKSEFLIIKLQRSIADYADIHAILLNSEPLFKEYEAVLYFHSGKMIPLSFPVDSDRRESLSKEAEKTALVTRLNYEEIPPRHFVQKGSTSDQFKLEEWPVDNSAEKLNSKDEPDDQKITVNSNANENEKKSSLELSSLGSGLIKIEFHSTLESILLIMAILSAAMTFASLLTLLEGAPFWLPVIAILCTALFTYLRQQVDEHYVFDSVNQTFYKSSKIFSLKFTSKPLPVNQITAITVNGHYNSKRRNLYWQYGTAIVYQNKRFIALGDAYRETSRRVVVNEAKELAKLLGRRFVEPKIRHSIRFVHDNGSIEYLSSGEALRVLYRPIFFLLSIPLLLGAISVFLQANE